MRRNLIQSSVRNRLGNGLLFLSAMIVCLMDQRPARATCGDYLSGRGMSGHGMASNHHGLNSPASSPDSLQDSTRQQRSTPFRHCSGPRCQRHDPIPVAPTREITLPGLNEGILCPAPDGLRAAPAFHGRCDGEDLVVDGPAGRIFRPPRSA
jgi:hypothetical protein